MNEQLSLLIQLQEVDGTIRVRRQEQAKIPGQLAALDQRIQESTARLEQVREALANAQKTKRDRDRDLDEGGSKVEKLKARTSEIKTNKEYQAFLKEIEAAEQENKAIEEDILKLMESIEASSGEIQSAEQRAAEESAVIAAERKQLAADMAEAEGALKVVEQARAELAARIDRGVLAQYQRLVGPLNARVVVEARSESCSGCFMSIPPQLFVNVKKNEQILSCPHCHRLLYYKEAIAPQNP